MVKMSLVVCKVCKKSFKYPSALKRHQNGIKKKCKSSNVPDNNEIIPDEKLAKREAHKSAKQISLFDENELKQPINECNLDENKEAQNELFINLLSKNEAQSSNLLSEQEAHFTICKKPYETNENFIHSHEIKTFSNLLSEFKSSSMNSHLEPESLYKPIEYDDNCKARKAQKAHELLRGERDLFISSCCKKKFKHIQSMNRHKKKCKINFKIIKNENETDENELENNEN